MSNFCLDSKSKKNEKKYDSERSFATRSHIASIRTVDCKKHYLASGGADDSIYLYDMRSRTESGKLMHHDGTINCIAFTPDASHVMSGSSDGSIAVVRCGNWQLEKHWKDAHKGSSVNAISIHPTGKLALSVGGDGVLRTWNMIKGRQAYATNLVPKFKHEAKNINVLQWSPNGEKYLIAVNNKIDVYSVETAGICCEATFDSKIVSVQFLTDSNDILAIGHEDGNIRIYNITENSEIYQTKAHESRVKCIECRDNKIISASSSGEVKLWKFANGKMKMLTSTNCDARITCMTLV